MTQTTDAVPSPRVQKYGSVVRISPWHVSFASPEAPARVYAQGSAALDKSPFYKAFYVQGNESLFRSAGIHLPVSIPVLTTSLAPRTALCTRLNVDYSLSRSRYRASVASKPSCANHLVATYNVSMLSVTVPALAMLSGATVQSICCCGSTIWRLTSSRTLHSASLLAW